MKFLHTADWQVGLSPAQFDEKGERLARILDLIDQHSHRLQFVILSCHAEGSAQLHGATRRELARGETLPIESLVGAVV